MRHARRLYWSTAAVWSSTWEEEGVGHRAQDQPNKARMRCSLSIEEKFIVACGRTAAVSPFTPSSDGTTPDAVKVLLSHSYTPYFTLKVRRDRITDARSAIHMIVRLTPLKFVAVTVIGKICDDEALPLTCPQNLQQEVTSRRFQYISGSTL